ncbi:MAG TPA: M14 family zinc carboxypeptidase [Mycobacteriales bacterium]|nr:M14 family zinc carboxypeptidase [Mycobacteriales bacterium]
MIRRLLPRRVLASASVLLLPVALATTPLPKLGGERFAMATPVADNDALYTACGRVFPDPQAFAPSPTPLPGESPWAKGNMACRATQFIQYAEAISGLHYLESRYPDFVEVYDLSKDFPAILNTDEGEGMTAGIPVSTIERERSPLTLVRVTDEKSSIPELKKEHFVFPLSIHGIERAGIEGGLRAAEDLATWGATAPEQPVMETDDTSLPAGEVLKKSSVYFVLANPDGWRRGDVTSANPSFQRYNGNGMDMNRDWPAIGWTFKPFTPWSEPETRSFGKVLQAIGPKVNGKPKWTGGIDLHGQLIDRAFSFTLLGGSQRPYGKDRRVLQFTKGAWADAETRLSWNPLIKPNSEPPSCAFVEDPTTEDCDETLRIYGVQWGTIWDTIAYTVTGAFGDWIDSPMGLDADGIDNEMSLSHLSNCGTGTCYIQTAEQLHVDGNKSLIYAMLNYSLLPEDQAFRYSGRAAYLTGAPRVRDAARPSPKAPPGVPSQEDLSTTLAHDGQGDTTYEFEVKGTADGVYNGGISAQVTYSNVQGLSSGATLSVYIDREDQGEWVEQVKDYNQSPLYVQAGMKTDLNFPAPGNYRVRIAGAAPVAISLVVDFTTAPAWPDPGQLAVDASNLDFFEELKPFVASKDQLTGISPAQITTGSVKLSQFDTLIAADSSAIRSDKALAAKARQFVEQGGNLVLTDDAMLGLEQMGVVPAGSVSESQVYAGHVEFEREFEGELEVTYEDPLAANVNQPGAAEGPNHRHQVTEPVPLGFGLPDEDSEAATQMQWVVAADAFEAAGGRVVGRLQGSDVTFGEIELGAGRIRVLGSLLPTPTLANDHRFGLADYALTYTGYELARNMFDHVNPRGTTKGPVVVPPQPAPAPKPNPQPAPQPRPLPATGAEAPWVAAATVAIGLALAVRARRTRSA